MIRVAGIWALFICLFSLTTKLMPIDGFIANSIAAAFAVLFCLLAFRRRAHIDVLPPLFVVTLFVPITILIAMGGEGFASNSLAFFQSLDFSSGLQLVTPLTVGALIAFTYGFLNRPKS